MGEEKREENFIELHIDVKASKGILEAVTLALMSFLGPQVKEGLQKIQEKQHEVKPST